MFSQTHEITHTKPMKPVDHGKPVVCFANPESKPMDIPVCRK